MRSSKSGRNFHHAFQSRLTYWAAAVFRVARRARRKKIGHPEHHRPEMRPVVVHLGHRDALGERAKRRLVGFVPQRFHPALVKRLLGTDPVNPAQEPAHFGREPFFASRIEQRGERRGRQRLQHLGALTVMVANVVRIRVEIHLVVELLQRTVQPMLNDQLRDDLARAGPRDVAAARFPQHDMQDHVVELAIAFVAVMIPILRPQMDLNVARALGLVTDLQRRMPKIGTGSRFHQPWNTTRTPRPSVVCNAPGVRRWSYQMHCTSRSLTGIGT